MRNLTKQMRKGKAEREERERDREGDRERETKKHVSNYIEQTYTYQWGGVWAIGEIGDGNPRVHLL